MVTFSYDSTTRKNSWGGGAKFDALIYCLSTDEKPTDKIDPNSFLLELDTGDLYYYPGEGYSWTKFGTAPAIV